MKPIIYGPNRLIARGLRRSLALTAALLVTLTTTTLLAPGSAWAFDATGGRYQFQVSPQTCVTRYASQSIYLYRSTYGQVINRRNKPLQLICPLLRTMPAENKDDCNTAFSVQVHFRTRPSVSRDPTVIKLSVAYTRGSYAPAVYQLVRTHPFSDMTWDGSSTYTDIRSASLSVQCTNTQADGSTVDVDAQQWTKNLHITLPPGAQLRGIYSTGGENNPG